MINIYEKDTSNFNNNGLATLQPTECLFKPIINRVWGLEMTLPHDNEGKSLLIQNDRILKVTGIDCISEQTAEYQLFKIYEYKKEDSYITLIAYPIGLDARFDTFTESVKLFNKTASEALTQINAISNKYTVSGSGYDSSRKSAEYANANLVSILNGADSTIGQATYHNFVKTWDGEICYDNYNLRVNHRMGSSSNPVDVRFGKNIIGMSYELDASNVITRLFPRAKSGEILNPSGNTHHVDAPNFSDYPIPHIYYVETPFSLVQLSNDGSLEYQQSSILFEAIQLATTNWLRKALLEDEVYGGLLKEIELDWINNNYALTMINDGVQGIVEYMWRKLINSSHANIREGAIQSLIYNAMKAGFDDVLKNTSSGAYIGSASKKMHEGSFEDEKYYSYTWDLAGTYRVKNNEYAWVYVSSKWQQLNADGITTGATDKTKWKWYKKKGKSYKLYGNKKKSRALKLQWWKINDVWYWFTSGGEGKKGSALNTIYYEYFDDAEVEFTDGVNETLYDTLMPICIAGASQLTSLLNQQMEDYCENLFATQRLSYPTIALEINMIDLSQTTEYKDFAQLERVHLGDDVKVTNPRILAEPTTVRVIGLTYDVLRKMNTEIQIGVTESSVINLLDSIGKGKDEVKYVAGDGITIENNTISVIPPSQPYLEDVLVNGESVVRNHKAYVDLDEMGIDESTHVIFGEEDPDEDDGENGDIYVKIPPHYEPNELTLNTESVWEQVSINRDEDNGTYNIVIGGIGGTTDSEFVAYKIDGLVQGRTYNFSFDAKMSDGCLFYDDWISGGVLTGQSIVGITFQNSATYYNNMPAYPNEYNAQYRYMSFYRDDLKHHYENSFTATSNTMYMIAEFNGVVDGTYRTLTLNDVLIKDAETYEFITENVFYKHEDEWHKYIPPTMIGATSSADGASGIVPKPNIADRNKFFKGDGTWGSVSVKNNLFELDDVDVHNLNDNQIISYNDSTQKWENVPKPNEVWANPSDPAQYTLYKLEIDGLVYDIGGGGGSSGIIIGTDEPTASVGSNNNVYLQVDNKRLILNETMSTNAWARPIIINADISDFQSITVRYKSGGKAVNIATIYIGDFTYYPSSSDYNYYYIVPNTDGKMYVTYNSNDMSFIRIYIETGTQLYVYWAEITCTFTERVSKIYAKTNYKWFEYNPYENTLNNV